MVERHGNLVEFRGKSSLEYDVTTIRIQIGVGKILDSANFLSLAFLLKLSCQLLDKLAVNHALVKVG